MELLVARWRSGRDGSRPPPWPGSASLAGVPLPGPQLLWKAPLGSSLPGLAGACGPVGLRGPSTTLAGPARCRMSLLAELSLNKQLPGVLGSRGQINRKREKQKTIFLPLLCPEVFFLLFPLPLEV